MAKKTAGDGLSELEHLERLAKLTESDRLQYTRDLERSISRERQAKREALRQVKTYEKELSASEAALGRMLHLQESTALRKYEKAARRGKSSSKATAVVCISDWYTEQTIDPHTVAGVNEFNLEIADRRIARTWDRACYLIDFARNISNIDEVCLWAGGDLINGMIHEELQQTSSLGPADAIEHVRAHILAGVRLLMKETKCKHFRFLANYGNHGRAPMKKRIATAASHSWEFGLYTTVAQIIQSDRTLAKRFSAQIARGELLETQIQGYNCRFTHGDTVRYHGGVGGIATPIAKAVAAWDASHGRADLTVLGHYHQFWNAPHFVANGCLCGFDPYAQSIRAKSDHPSQTLIVMDQEYGRVLATQIFCEEHPTVTQNWQTPNYVR